METLIYNSNNIEITTNGTSNFLYSDHSEEIYGEYDYTEIENFIEEINYLDDDIVSEILTKLDEYYLEDNVISGSINIDFNLNKSDYFDLLRICNNLSNEYNISYKSEKH